MSFLLSLDDLLLEGLGPQQAVLFLKDFRLSYLHRLEVVTVSASSTPPPYGVISRSADLTPVGAHSSNLNSGASLAVHWLRLCASKARGMGLIPGQRTKIPQMEWCYKKKKSLKSPWQPFCTCLFQWKTELSMKVQNNSSFVTIILLY